jgi:RNA polymerase sigma-70 factor, ECF subfamily
VSNHINDDALMAAVARGEEAAFRLLVQRWEREVMAFLVHMLSSVQEAEDLTQETFVQVFRKAGRYQGEGKFQSWLFRIAGNQARSKLRRRKILRWVSFNPDRHDQAFGGDDPAAALVRKDEARLVNSALAGLPERQRQALVLHRFQGLKYKEIAETMDVSVAAVESLIQRAMSELRRSLAGKTDRS